MDEYLQSKLRSFSSYLISGSAEPGITRLETDVKMYLGPFETHEGYTIEISIDELDSICQFLAMEMNTTREFWIELLTKKAEEDGIDLQIKPLYLHLSVPGKSLF